VNLLSFLLVLAAESCAVTGQIFFKHAARNTVDRWGYARNLGLGIAVMSIYFFLWLGLLQKFDLSYLYPFDGVNRVMLVLAASFFLGEKATPRIWFGVILISAGMMLVSAS
jgi:undecaprenyl phosphate-alpha-L-ara4N flippase subunit ArnE